MRILIVSQHFWPEAFRINDLALDLVGAGHDVEVLTGKPNYPEGKLFPGYRAWGIQHEMMETVPVHRVPLAPRGKGGGVRLAWNYLSFILSGCLLGHIALRKSKFDVIFVYGTSPILQAIPALWLGWLRRRPVVIWVQDLWPESLEATGFVKSRRLLGLVAKVVQQIYRRSNRILVQSEAFRSHIIAQVPGVQPLYYPNSVDRVFDGTAAGSMPRPAELPAGFTVVFTGNVGTAQAPETIIEAARRLVGSPEINMVMIGSGSRLEWMKSKAEELGLDNIHFLGRYPVEAMPAFQSHADVLLAVLSKQPIFAMTIPSKIQSYLASGRPIIAAMDGEGARIVEEAGAGLGVPAEDAAALAEAIKELYRITREERRVLGTNGTRYFERNFSRQLLVAQLINHFTDVSMERD